jgi:error-prone DNA polymerase
MTIEDETGIANVVVWSSLFERQRRVVLPASMVGCRGHVQREGDVIHLVAEQLEDLTPLLRSVRNRDAASVIQPLRGTMQRPRLLTGLIRGDTSGGTSN